MEYRALGRTGLQVSAVGLGAWEIGGAVKLTFEGLGAIAHGYGAVNDREAVQLIHRCEDLGINFVDTAPIYGDGHSEELLGEALAGRRERWVLCTKSGHGATGGQAWTDFSEPRILSQIEESLKRLCTDHVDLYLLHGPRPADVARGDCLAALRKLKEQGKARFVGVSLGGNQMGVELCRRRLVDVLQQAIGLAGPSAIGELLPAAREANVGIIGRGVFAAGFLTGAAKADTEFAQDDRRSWMNGNYKQELAGRAEKLAALVTPTRTLAQLCVRFVLDQPGVSTVICGSKTFAHMEENARATDLAPLTAAEQEQLRQLGFNW
jgi:aryl-alcohol dehydrogenase-like predicted oxidoreductase